MKKPRNYVHKFSQKLNRPATHKDRKKDEKTNPPKVRDWRYDAQ